MSLTKYLTFAFGTGIPFETEAEAVGNAQAQVTTGTGEVGVYQLIGIARRAEQPVVYEPIEAPRVKYLLEWKSRDIYGEWSADRFAPHDSREVAEALKEREEALFPEYYHRIVEVPA